MKTSDRPIFLSHFYDASVSKVWLALTEPKEMRAWYFKEIEEFEPREGFSTQFTFETQGKLFTTNWNVTEVIPNKLIRYAWNYEAYHGNSEVCFRLEEKQNQTILQFEITILEDFPCDMAEFSRESAQIGWKYVLGEALKNHLKTQGNE